ncbi:hypothetical protein IFM89_004477, partial [Coptis chinensis]
TKLKEVQSQVQENVKRMMYEKLYTPTLGCKKRKSFGQTKPDMIVSCSAFGPKGTGGVARISTITTESVYRILHLQLASMDPLLGASPYH